MLREDSTCVYSLRCRVPSCLCCSLLTMLLLLPSITLFEGIMFLQFDFLYCVRVCVTALVRVCEDRYLYAANRAYDCRRS